MPNGGGAGVMLSWCKGFVQWFMLWFMLVPGVGPARGGRCTVPKPCREQKYESCYMSRSAHVVNLISSVRYYVTTYFVTYLKDKFN